MCWPSTAVVNAWDYRVFNGPAFHDAGPPYRMSKPARGTFRRSTAPRPKAKKAYSRIDNDTDATSGFACQLHKEQGAGMPKHQVRVDLRVFPLVVIQKTAAGFSDRYTVTISQVSGEEIAVDFTVRAGSAPLPDLPIAFHDRLLDLALQEQITAQTKDIRLALVRAALAEALPQTK